MSAWGKNILKNPSFERLDQKSELNFWKPFEISRNEFSNYNISRTVKFQGEISLVLSNQNEKGK